MSPRARPRTAEGAAASKALGEAMRAARKEPGDTQASVAGRAGLDRSHYAALERGELNPKYTTIVEVAKALGMTAVELLERAGL